jgi:hypothetical protein
VSPRPRRAPAATACRPSKIWNTAATCNSGTAASTTAGSSVTSRATTGAARANISALHPMNAVPVPMPTKPARRAPTGSSAPTACPTRTALAALSPKHIEKVNDTSCSATLWPPTATAPNAPASTVVTTNDDASAR